MPHPIRTPDTTTNHGFTLIELTWFLAFETTGFYVGWRLGSSFNGTVQFLCAMAGAGVVFGLLWLMPEFEEYLDRRQALKKNKNPPPPVAGQAMDSPEDEGKDRLPQPPSQSQSDGSA